MMETDFYKPTIMIGHAGNLDECSHVLEGIEEYGCIWEIYAAESEQDVRCSTLDTAIIIGEKTAGLFIRPLGAEAVQVADLQDRKACFRLGKNAARYVKGKAMEL